MISPDTFSLTDSEQSRFAHVQRLGSKGAGNVSELLEMLTDPSWVVRRSVVETLAEVGEVAVAPLIDLLRNRRDNETRIAAVVDALSASSGPVEKYVIALAGDPTASIVADVAQILGRRRSPVSVSVLVSLTKHENDNVAVGAIEALGRIGGRAAVEALIEMVTGKNFFRIFPAIDVLGRSGDPRSVAPLAKLLADPTYLPEACRALGRSGETSAVEPLVDLLRSSVDAVVRVAACSLAELREHYQEKSGGELVIIDGLIRKQVKAEMTRRLGRVLQHSDTGEAAAMCSLLGAIGDAEATSALTTALESEGPVAMAAAAALNKNDRDVDTSLIKALRDGSSERRKVLLPLVMRSSLASQIAICLSDADPEVRALTCDSLARLGNVAVVREIYPLLEDENLRVVHSATAALQALGSRETRALAAKASESSNPVVRRSGLRVLSYFGDSSALQPLLRGLHDADPRVQEAAIQGLPFLEEKEALEAIFQSAKSDVARVRALSMRALGQLQGANDEVYAVLTNGLKDPESWTRYYSSQSLGRLRYIPAAPDIAKLLSDEAGQVRVAAVEALSHLNSPIAHNALRRAAEGNELEVRRAALVGLGLSRYLENLPILLKAVGSSDIATRLMALSAISNFSSDRVLGALSTAASDADDQVSASAISILGTRNEQEATEVLVQLLADPARAEKVKTALLVPSDGRISGLLIALESADHELAAILVSILSRLRRPETRSALLSAVKLHNVAARKAAAPALAARRDPEMTAALQEAAENDPDSEVRQICAILLRQ